MNTPLNDRSTAPRLLLTVEEAARRLSIGRTTAFALIAEGRLTTVRIGRSRRVPADALAPFVDSLGVGPRQTPGGVGPTAAAPR